MKPKKEMSKQLLNYMKLLSQFTYDNLDTEGNMVDLDSAWSKLRVSEKAYMNYVSKKMGSMTKEEFSSTFLDGSTGEAKGG